MHDALPDDERTGRDGKSYSVKLPRSVWGAGCRGHLHPDGIALVHFVAFELGCSDVMLPEMRSEYWYRVGVIGVGTLPVLLLVFFFYL